MKIVINKSTVDQFTLVHLGAGVLARHFGMNLVTTIFLGVVWDFGLEPALKGDYPSLFPYPSQDAPKHAIVDAVAPAVGWIVTDWIKRASA